MNARLAFMLALGAAVLTGPGCTPSLQRRVERSTAYLATLPPAQQEAVRMGRLEPGMPREAVMVAWGKPNHFAEALAENGRPEEIWLYTGQRPVAVEPAWLPPPVIDCYGRIHWPYPSPAIAYVPYLRARVMFRNGQVVAWENLRPR
jgi:hypothetical protein